MSLNDVPGQSSQWRDFDSLPIADAQSSESTVSRQDQPAKPDRIDRVAQWLTIAAMMLQAYREIKSQRKS